MKYTLQLGLAIGLLIFMTWFMITAISKMIDMGLICKGSNIMATARKGACGGQPRVGKKGDPKPARGGRGRGNGRGRKK